MPFTIYADLSMYNQDQQPQHGNNNLPATCFLWFWLHGCQHWSTVHKASSHLPRKQCCLHFLATAWWRTTRYQHHSQCREAHGHDCWRCSTTPASKWMLHLRPTFWGRTTCARPRSSFIESTEELHTASPIWHSNTKDLTTARRIHPTLSLLFSRTSEGTTVTINEWNRQVQETKDHLHR